MVVVLRFPAVAQQPDTDMRPNKPVAQLTFLLGNRIASVAGIPGDPSTYYAGAASGGVWKSIDGGNRFVPVFDKQPAAAIGALAVAPSDPSVVWAGTGEAWVIRDSDVMGNGIYKSTDAGKTWTNVGLRETGRIGRIIVHPTNPDIVFACALGRATGPQQERGVFRSTDGGQHWERVLFANENVGCSGLSMDPSIDAIGRRRSPSILSTTIPFIPAAKLSLKPPMAARVGLSSAPTSRRKTRLILFLPAVSWGITWGNSMVKLCSPLLHPRFKKA
jgi:hypothetical protein